MPTDYTNSYRNQVHDTHALSTNTRRFYKTGPDCMVVQTKGGERLTFHTSAEGLLAAVKRVVEHSKEDALSAAARMVVPRLTREAYADLWRQISPSEDLAPLIAGAASKVAGGRGGWAHCVAAVAVIVERGC